MHIACFSLHEAITWLLKNERTIILRKFLISVDSSACFKEEEIQKFGLMVAHLSYTLDGQEFEDSFHSDEEKQVFYDQLAEGHVAQSARVNPDGFSNVWKSALEDGHDIIHFSLSGNVSGSYESACVAARTLLEKYDRRIEVVDTKTGSYATTALVLDIAKLPETTTIDEAVKYARSILKEYNLIFTVGDIKHLYKGGRISHIQAMVGSLLHFKPVLFVNNEGKLTLMSNVRGMKKALNLMISKMEKNITHHTNCAYIAHGGDKSLAQLLKQKIMEFFPNLQNIRIDYLTPVLGLHAGPGSLVLCFRGADRDHVLKDNPIQDILDQLHLSKLKNKTVSG